MLRPNSFDLKKINQGILLLQSSLEEKIYRIVSVFFFFSLFFFEVQILTGKSFFLGGLQSSSQTLVYNLKNNAWFSAWPLLIPAVLLILFTIFLGYKSSVQINLNQSTITRLIKFFFFNLKEEATQATEIKRIILNKKRRTKPLYQLIVHKGGKNSFLIAESTDKNMLKDVAKPLLEMTRLSLIQK